MKALVFHGPHQLSWEEWPSPTPGAGEVLVAVRAVGICGSDLHGFTGESGRRIPPMVMGHEATGEVVGVGPGVPSNLVGMHVILQPFLWCDECDMCRSGRTNLCRNRRFLGATAGGAMAEQVVLTARNVLPLPDSLSFIHGTLTEPLSVALHAVAQAGDLRGKAILIAGSGAIGLLTLLAARRAGAAWVAMTDPITLRRETACALGADLAVNPRDDDWRDRLISAPGFRGGEFDAAFDAVGIAATLQQAIQTVRPGGMVVALGGWQTVPVNLAPLVAHEVTVRGTFNFTPAEFDEARGLLADEAELRLEQVVTAAYPLADGADIFAQLVNHPAQHIKVVLTGAT